MRKLTNVLAVLLIAVLINGCSTTTTYNQTGKMIAYQPGKIGLGSTKLETINAYGQPTKQRAVGDLNIYVYTYQHDQFKHDKMIQQGAAAFFTLGIAPMFMDHSITNKDLITDRRALVFYFDHTDKVVNFYYNDSKGNGHDESETIFLKAVAVTNSDIQEGIRLYKQSVEANPNNHHALNALAWYLADMGIDPKAGVGYAEKAVKLWPYQPNYWDTLGTAQLKTGDVVGAKASLEKAINLYPVYEPTNTVGFEHSKQLFAQAEQQLSKKATKKK